MRPTSRSSPAPRTSPRYGTEGPPLSHKAHRNPPLDVQMRKRLRHDDNAEVFEARLKAYRAQTPPVTEYYRSQGLLKIVNGPQPIDAVSEELTRALSAFA